ncbi:GL19099 [Drosophila persimilis]|uniref:Vitelline membrane protein Vm26Aa n=2 Tax=pseudoobscura subgroup TaxID=32358 RepID=Q29PL6_DROPS|nr:vitelline membrane protein Vm26Aa [Drosophila pseudoobscura]XP_002014250.1 vitelline membrane protein Vm26Aa [Drosophila persimilis]XP_017155333.1 vitelline membrane protein Vm26Aa [Drosophila miranda]EDW28246.1 GL19099 [Drosophila persimilis]
MNSFVCFALIALAATSALATPTNVGSSANAGSTVSLASQDGEVEGITNQGYGDLTRLRKSAYGGSSGGGSYGGSSIPAPPCPKNYLFSCQPNLAPVPCSAPAPSYGSAGAYSSPVATYVAPNYGVPQHQQQLYSAAYVPQQAYGYHY